MILTCVYTSIYFPHVALRPFYKFGSLQFVISTMLALGFIIVALNFISCAQEKDYAYAPCQGNRRPIVQLFQWSWDAVAEECKTVLGPKGFCGVQISPPQEHIKGEEWWTVYQPVSYKLESNFGNREQFINMVETCNSAGVMYAYHHDISSCNLFLTN